MPEGHEPSLLEYARFHGLARDHLESHPLHNIRLPDDYLQQLEDQPDLFHIDASNATVPVERLSIDTDAASMLASIAPSSTAAFSRFDEDIDNDTHRIRNLKEESPLLRTNHEWDLQHFARQVVPDLETEFLPLESINEEADEGFTWPTKYYEFVDEVWKGACSEKLEIPNEGLLCLQQSLKYHLENGAHTSFEEVEMSYKKVKLMATLCELAH